MRRSTIVPTSRTSSSSPSPSQMKSFQMNRLVDQLSKLQSNMSHLENHLHVTAIQAEAIRRLGALQASLLMASGRVMSEARIQKSSDAVEEDVPI